MYLSFSSFPARQVLLYTDQPTLHEEPGTTLVVDSSDPNRSLGTHRHAGASGTPLSLVLNRILLNTWDAEPQPVTMCQGVMHQPMLSNFYEMAMQRRPRTVTPMLVGPLR